MAATGFQNTEALSPDRFAPSPRQRNATEKCLTFFGCDGPARTDDPEQAKTEGKVVGGWGEQPIALIMKESSKDDELEPTVIVGASFATPRLTKMLHVPPTLEQASNLVHDMRQISRCYMLAFVDLPTF